MTAGKRNSMHALILLFIFKPHAWTYSMHKFWQTFNICRYMVQAGGHLVWPPRALRAVNVSCDVCYAIYAAIGWYLCMVKSLACMQSWESCIHEYICMHACSCMGSKPRYIQWPVLYNIELCPKRPGIYACTTPCTQQDISCMHACIFCFRSGSKRWRKGVAIKWVHRQRCWSPSNSLHDASL